MPITSEQKATAIAMIDHWRRLTGDMPMPQDVAQMLKRARDNAEWSMVDKLKSVEQQAKYALERAAGPQDASSSSNPYLSIIGAALSPPEELRNLNYRYGEASGAIPSAWSNAGDRIKNAIARGVLGGLHMAATMPATFGPDIAIPGNPMADTFGLERQRQAMDAANPPSGLQVLLEDVLTQVVDPMNVILPMAAMRLARKAPGIPGAIPMSRPAPISPGPVGIPSSAQAAMMDALQVPAGSIRPQIPPIRPGGFTPQNVAMSDALGLPYDHTNIIRNPSRSTPTRATAEAVSTDIAGGLERKQPTELLTGDAYGTGRLVIPEEGGKILRPYPESITPRRLLPPDQPQGLIQTVETRRPQGPPVAAKPPKQNVTFGQDDVSRSRFYRKSNAGAEPAVTISDDDYATLKAWKEGGMTTPPPETGLTPGQSERFARGELPVKSPSNSVTLYANPIGQGLKLAGQGFKEIGKGVGKAAQWAGGQPRKVWRDMIDRVGDEGGMVGKAIAHQARRIADHASEIEGRLNPEIRKLEEKYGTKLVSGRPTAISQLDEWLKTPDADGMTNAQKLVDGEISPANAEQAQWKADYIAIEKRIGAEAIRAGMKRQLKGGKTVDIVNTGSGKFIRSYTPEIYDAARRDTPWYQRLEQHVAKLNGWDQPKAREFMRQSFNPPVEREVGFLEHQRLIPRMPGVFEGVTIYPSGAIDSIKATVRHVADRIAVASEWGQGFGQLETRINRMRDKYVRAGGDRAKFDDLIQTLHGRTLSNPESLATESTAGRVTWGFLAPVYRAGAKSMAVLSNTPESLVMPKTLATASWRDNAAGRLLLRKGRALISELEGLGAKTVSRMTRDYEPGKALEKVGNTIEGAADRVTLNYYNNELQETQAGAIHLAMRDRIKSGKVLEGDDARLDLLKFTPTERRMLLSGKAPQSLYDDIVRRGVKYTTGSNERNAERSWLQNKRWFNRVEPFQSYSMMSARHADEMNRMLVRQWKQNGIKGVLKAIPTVAKSYTGHTATGGLSLTLAAIAAGRYPNWSDSTAENVILSLVAAGMAPEMRVYQQVFGKGDRLADGRDLISNLSPATRLIVKAMDAWVGRGQYADKDASEKIGMLLKSQIPITKLQGAYLVAVGMKDPKMDKAITDFWKWARENQANIGGEERSLIGYQAFRKYNREMADALLKGDVDSANKAARQAYMAGINDRDKGKVRDAMKSSLLGRRLITKISEDKRAKMEAELGRETMDYIRRHDEILQNAANSIKPSGGIPMRTRSRGRTR